MCKPVALAHMLAHKYRRTVEFAMSQDEIFWWPVIAGWNFMVAGNVHVEWCPIQKGQLRCCF